MCHTVACNKNKVLTFFGFWGFLNLFSTTRCCKRLKLCGNTTWGVASNFCKPQPFLCTFCHKRTRVIGMGNIATTEKKGNLSAKHFIEFSALERGEKWAKKVK